MVVTVEMEATVVMEVITITELVVMAAMAAAVAKSIDQQQISTFYFFTIT
jgi:hypothetical protein